MDQIAKAKHEAIIAHRATNGRLERVCIGYKTKCLRDAFIRGWVEYEERFPFLKRLPDKLPNSYR